ncbi:hypothetical protein MPS_4118 [Mycobacterium pseudoshottsii JCM 15466]|nr:hypothetical protein DL240490_01660 [Mycobacterium marinum]BBA90039.1 hypothetical protein MPSD_47220 [Mycobacterium pseudoshottsii JCM 15466]GAQ38350.1 hypothetical protein MPS_4118 [Mycobacterium pseudoshottsii JCM 15466]
MAAFEAIFTGSSIVREIWLCKSAAATTTDAPGRPGPDPGGTAGPAEARGEGVTANPAVSGRTAWAAGGTTATTTTAYCETSGGAAGTTTTATAAGAATANASGGGTYRGSSEPVVASGATLATGGTATDAVAAVAPGTTTPTATAESG